MVTAEIANCRSRSWTIWRSPQMHHIDLGYLPKDLWTDRLPSSLRDRAPHVEERGEQGEYWVCDGEVWGD